MHLFYFCLYLGLLDARYEVRLRHGGLKAKLNLQLEVSNNMVDTTLSDDCSSFMELWSKLSFR